jgi:aminopeptidase-like protein
MKRMLELIGAIAPLRLAPVSEETDEAVRILCGELPFRVHEYASGEEHNGWNVPLSWQPERAEIRRDGRVIFDGMRHPLAVVGYGVSFSGRVGAEELKRHLFYNASFPNAFVYHCDYFYKPWKRDWGFSVPLNFYRGIEDGEYDVDIVTREYPGTMKVLEYVLPGESDESYLLNAHDCHAAQANDDISGVVVGIEVMRRLSKLARRRFTYRLVVAPEHLGTVFFTKNQSSFLPSVKGAIFLEMLGNRNRMALQHSFTGDSIIDAAMGNVLRHGWPDAVEGPFRTIVGNDETVWEAPGIEIPCVSLSRFPYPEYHSSMDTEDIIHADMLDDAVDAVLSTIEILETNGVAERCFTGLIALSNPKYDLYISTEDPSIRVSVSEDQKKWHYMMTCLPRYFDGRTSFLDIAEKLKIDYFKLRSYIGGFESKGLIRILYPCTS